MLYQKARNKETTPKIRRASVIRGNEHITSERIHQLEVFNIIILCSNNI